MHNESVFPLPSLLVLTIYSSDTLIPPNTVVLLFLPPLSYGRSWSMSRWTHCWLPRG